MAEHDPLEASLSALAVLRDERASVAERHGAFEKMLDLPSGWWGNYTLVLFAHACALATARRLMGGHGLSPDALDWEAAADEALIALANKAHTIRESPRGWLMAVIRNQLRDAVRESWQELTATKTEDLRPEDHPPSSDERLHVDDERLRSTERAQLQAYDALLGAIQTLTPTLRVVAQMVLIDRYTVSEAAAILGIPQATTRKRLQRLRRQLQSKLAAGPSGQD